MFHATSKVPVPVVFMLQPALSYKALTITFSVKLL